MSEQDLKVIGNIEKEITKIKNKENKIFFFVIDSKGIPSGSLEYIYNLALIAKNDGYDVAMLHTEDEFVGVESWLGEEYASLPHYNVNKGEVATSPSDVLFIPEIYAQVMNQSKQLPCKRVAILQNYDYVVDQMPYAAQWGDFGILEGITNSDSQKEKLNEVFPYVKLTKVSPFISKVFGQTIEPKKMVVNVITRDQEDIKKIVKPFYWKYPYFKWVSFRDVRNQSKKDFAKSLREAAITIVVDDSASVMYSALESMKSGCVTMVKVPETNLDWTDTEDGSLPNCCVWFDDFDTLHKQIASVVRSWITDKVPTVLNEEAKKILEQFSEEKTKDEFLKYLNSVLERRTKEMDELVIQVKSQNKEQ
jgi:hypothetical protein